MESNKTAMMLAIDIIHNHTNHTPLYNDEGVEIGIYEYVELKDIIYDIIRLLPVEKEQIKDAIKDVAPQLCFILPGDAENLAETYYEATYKTETNGK